MCGKYENINYMIVTQDPVYNSILSLHLGRGMVSSVRMISFVRMASLVSQSAQNGKVHLGRNVRSSTYDCGCVVNGGGAMAAT